MTKKPSPPDSKRASNTAAGVKAAGKATETEMSRFRKLATKVVRANRDDVAAEERRERDEKDKGD